MNKWKKLANNKVIEKTVEALGKNGIEAVVVNNGQEARMKALELIPEGAEVMNMTSVTIDSIGLSDELNNSGKFDSVKNKLANMDRETQNQEMQRIGAAPEWAIGSVHAITESGEVIIGSNSGSQLPAYAYGASHVLWIAGTHKIVNNLEDGLKRVHEFVLPLESERAKKAYGVQGSNLSKILILNKEQKKNRITLILVNEVLGF